eukprot:jgi/Mesvir1/17942/Mv12993-RA.3
MASGKAVTLAILGCGVFARDTYAPVLKTLEQSGHVVVAACWSRSRASSEAMREHLGRLGIATEARWGDGPDNDERGGLHALLADESLSAVAVVVPPQGMRDIVERALAAGKHVLQEKPIALTAARGAQMVESYERGFGVESKVPRIWFLAENYRFESGLIEAGALVASLGRMVMAEMVAEMPMNAANKYFNSGWRRDPATDGFMGEGAVHLFAGLRVVTGCDITHIAAQVSHADQELPPPDTACAVLSLSNGCPAIAAISFAARVRKIFYRVVCLGGSVEVERTAVDGVHGYKVTCIRHEVSGHDPATETVRFYRFSGVEDEIATFIANVAAFPAQVQMRMHKRTLSLPHASHTHTHAHAHKHTHTQT